MDNKDKRNFKRYKKEAELILKANTGAYKGRVIDYFAPLSKMPPLSYQAPRST